MIKHFELAKFTEKSVLLGRFLDLLAKYPPLWISKFKTFGKNIFLRTPPNRKYSTVNKIIVQNQIISSSLDHM